MKFLSRLDDFEHIVIDGSVSGTGLSSLYLKDTATPILRIGNNTGDSFITYDGSELSISSDVDLRLTTPTDQDVFLITSSGNITTTQAGGIFTIGGGLTLEAITGGFLKADANGVVSVDNSTFLTNETDTLDSVTDRGATTTNSITVGGITVGDSHFIGNETTYDNLVIISSTGENINLAAANGIYFNTNAVSASNVGDNRMYLSNGGNLGIGTTSPAGRIDIRGNYGRWRINGYGGMYFRNDSDTGYTRYIHPRSDGSLSFGRIADANLSGSDPDKFAASSYDQFYLEAGGTAVFNGGISFPGVNGANFVVDTDGQRIVWEHQRNGTRRMTFYHETDQDTFNFNFESGNELQINGNRIITEDEIGTAAASAATDFVAVSGDEMTGRLTLNQNVTIGGTTPANGNLVITDGSYSLGIDSNEIHSTNAMYIGTNSGDLILRPDGNTTITNGKLGVGTTTPGYLVEATGTIRATDSSGATGVGGAGLEVRYNTTDGAGSLLAYDRGNSQYKELRLEGSIIAVREAGSEIARFNGGKLGIGTTAPDYKTHIVSDQASDLIGMFISNSRSYGAGQGAHGAGIWLGKEESGGNQPMVGIIGRPSSESSSVNGNLFLQTRSSGSLTTKLTINGAGDITFSSYGAGILKTDSSGNISLDTNSYATTASLSGYLKIDGSSNDYRFNLNLSNFSGSRWYKVATVNAGSGGLYIRGLITNHVESFASQKVDIAIQGREGNANDEIEINGSFDVFYQGCGIRVVEGTKPGSYQLWDVYVKAVQYTQCNLDLNLIGGSFTTDGSYVTTEPGSVVELDTSSKTEGSYIIQDSSIHLNYHAGNTTIPVSGTDFDPVGTDNSTDVTLDTTSYDYLSITGQEITLGQIEYTTDIANTPTLGTAASSAATDFVAVSGDTMTGNLLLEDSVELRLGTDTDLKIYHDGTTGRIANNTGHLYIQNLSDDKDIYLRSDDGAGGLSTYLSIDGSDGLVNITKPLTLSNYGAGYLKTDASGVVSVDTSTIEDTLQTVTDRGNTSSNTIEFTGSANAYVGIQGETDVNLKIGTGAGSEPRIYLFGSANGQSNAGNIFIGTADNTGIVDINGDVDISGFAGFNGITAPDFPVDISSVDGGKVLRSTRGTSIFRIDQSNDGPGYIGMQSADDLSIQTNNTSKIYITSAGNVGIGTTSPDSTLHVSSASPIITISNSDTSLVDGQVIGQIDFKSLDASTNMTDVFGSIRTEAQGTLDNGVNDGGKMVFSTFKQSTTLVDQMVIDRDGNVGIGTTSPTAPLHVIGTVRMGDTSDGLTFTSGSGIGNIIGVDTGFAGYNAIAIKASANTGIYLDTADNVGIGTTNPTRKLHVSAGATVPAVFDSTQDYTLGLARSGTEEWWLKTYTDGRFAIHENGVGDKVTIKAGGNVGIGTTSPSEKLHVVGKGFFDGGRDVLIDSNLGNVRISAPSSGGWATGMYFDDAGGSDVGGFGAYGTATALEYFFIGDAYNDATMVIEPNAGNVGIGTTGPGEKLEVAGKILSKYGSSTNHAVIEHRDTSDNVIFSFRRSDGAGGNGNDLVIRAYEDIHLAPNNSDDSKFVVKANGKVGIGATSPTQKLDVDGNIVIPQGNFLSIRRSSVDNPILWQGDGTFGSTDQLYLRQPNNNNLHFQTNGGNTRMLITGAGNVGIGTTSPGAPLHVVGNIYNQSGRVYTDEIQGYTANSITIGDGNQTFNLISRGDEDFAITGGNVGIGETSPATKLHVVGTTETRLRVGSSNASSNVVLELRDENTPTGQGTVITYNNSTGETYFNNALSTATTDFHFQSGEYGTANDFFTLSNSGGNAILHLKTTSGDSFITYEDSTNELAIASDGDLRLTTPTDQDVFFISSGGNVDMTQAGGTVDMGGNLVVDGDGIFNSNVGIGTTSPNSKLEIRDTAPFLRITSTINDDVNSQGREYGGIEWYTEEDYGNAPVVTSYVKAIHTRAGSNHSNADAGLVFATSLATNDATATERMRIEAVTGNVGIGTASPSYKLTVDSGAADIGILTASSDSGSYVGFLDNATSVIPKIGAVGNKLVLDADNIGVGITSPSYQFHIDNDALNTNNAALYVRNPNSSNGAVIAEFVGDSDAIQIKNTNVGDYVIYNTQQSNGIALYDGTGGVEIHYNGATVLEADSSGGIKVTGQLSATGDVVAYSSDERLKENIKPIENAVDKIKKLKGVTFDWNEKSQELGFEPSTKTNDVGVIAQDVEAVFPQLVHLAPFDIGSDEEGKATSKTGEDYKTVNYARLTAVLIEAVKEQQQQIDELKEIINGFTK